MASNPLFRPFTGKVNFKGVSNVCGLDPQNPTHQNQREPNRKCILLNEIISINSGGTCRGPRKLEELDKKTECFELRKAACSAAQVSTRSFCSKKVASSLARGPGAGAGAPHVQTPTWEVETIAIQMWDRGCPTGLAFQPRKFLILKFSNNNDQKICAV